MKRIFLDTNFIIDYFVREDYRGDAEKVMKWGYEKNCTFFISYLTVANFAYIMRKLPTDQLYDIIKRICMTFSVMDNTMEQISLNLQFPFADFEDGLQYQTAKQAKCDCFITRNKEDYLPADIRVMTPQEFISYTTVR